MQPDQDNDQSELQRPQPASEEKEVPQAPKPRNTSTTSVEWTASEFVAHTKGAGWYLILIIGTTVLAVLTHVIAHNILSTIVIVLAGIVFGVVAARQPRVLQYAISDTGIHIEQKNYPYETFKSFGIAEDEAIHSIIFMPMKRFNSSLTIYYAPEDEDKIVDALAIYLPLQPEHNDLMDRLMRKIRF